MLFRKQKKAVIKLTEHEARIFRQGMLYFRNEAIRNGWPTEDINEILLKLM